MDPILQVIGGTSATRLEAPALFNSTRGLTTGCSAITESLVPLLIQGSSASGLLVLIEFSSSRGHWRPINWSCHCSIIPPFTGVTSPDWLLVLAMFNRPRCDQRSTRKWVTTQAMFNRSRCDHGDHSLVGYFSSNVQRSRCYHGLTHQWVNYSSNVQ